MARLGCKCGNTLSNSMCPSENVIYVMNKKRVEAALGYNPHLTLMDFITNWDELTDSKRVFISEEYNFGIARSANELFNAKSTSEERRLLSINPLQMRYQLHSMNC